MSDSKNSSKTWNLIGKFSVVIAIIYSVFHIYVAMTNPEEDLLLEIKYSNLEFPPNFSKIEDIDSTSGIEKTLKLMR